MKTLLKQWGGSTCTQDGPKDVGKKYSHDRATNCPISFAQICGLVLYVGEQKSPLHYYVLLIKLLFGDH